MFQSYNIESQHHNLLVDISKISEKIFKTFITKSLYNDPLFDKNIFCITQSFNYIDLDTACKLNSIGLVQLILKKLVNKDIPNEYYDNGFYEACIDGNKEIVILFINMCPRIHQVLLELHNKYTIIWRRYDLKVASSVVMTKFLDRIEITYNKNSNNSSIMTITNKDVKNIVVE